jgi:hypothetical protein
VRADLVYKLKMAALVLSVGAPIATLLVKIASWAPVVSREDVQAALVAQRQGVTVDYTARFSAVEDRVGRLETSNQAAHQSLQTGLDNVGHRVDQIYQVLVGANAAPSGPAFRRGRQVSP